jgi:DNA-binding response OmpR family regulator
MASRPSPVRRAPWRVLVVDDDAHSRTAVARLLSDEGYQAFVATDGEAAVAMLATCQPDLVVTDLHMPRLDGRQLLARLRCERPLTPVVVVSASAGGEGVAGADAFFTKPVPVGDLLARIGALLTRREPVESAG